MISNKSIELKDAIYPLFNAMTDFTELSVKNELDKLLAPECRINMCFPFEEIKGTKIRFQNVDGLPSKELRKLVDKGKKDLGEGIIVVFTTQEDKVGVAIGITDALTKKYDAVKFVKLSSEIIGGKGGGGRKDFAQAGGQDPKKINEAFNKLRELV